jgi:hypothetical protein
MKLNIHQVQATVTAAWGRQAFVVPYRLAGNLSWPNIPIRSLSGQSPKEKTDSEWLIVERMYYSARTPGGCRQGF